MRKSRFTVAQNGMPTAEVCCRHGLSAATFYKLKSKYGGLEVSEAARLKALEDENARLSACWRTRCWTTSCRRICRERTDDIDQAARRGAPGDAGS